MGTDNPFEKVLDRLREKGWMKGESGDDAGPNCIMGAYCRVWKFGPDQMIGQIARDQYPDRVGWHENLVEAAQFNDHPDTTFSDVERVLEKAAVKWEEERVLRND